MKVGAAIAEILKREGVQNICVYPLNYLTEFAADADIRPIITRAERTAGHMADAVSRLSSGRKIGVYATQHGPGIENGMGAVAQAYAESVPLLVLPMGYPRKEAFVDPHFNSTISLRSFSKSVEPIFSAADVPAVLRRAFTRLKNGRGGPVVVEIPMDMFSEELPGPLDYSPVIRTRSAPDPQAIRQAARLLVEAQRPVIYAGQGVHYAEAWPQLRRFAETLAIPVCTSLEGKSAFPETHPLALGSGGNAMPKTVDHFLEAADLIFGIGCSFTRTAFGVTMPRNRVVIQATLDPAHYNNDIPVALGLTGDAALTLEALQEEVEKLISSPRDPSPVAAEIRAVHEAWMQEWLPVLTSDENPMTPYRVIWEMMHTLDVANTIITHDAGSPRDQLSPFWKCETPLSYLGWGKSTQLGYGFGLTLGAKLARPDKLCINVWGDAAFGFTGFELETAVREKLPVMSILFNNFHMAMETPSMGRSHSRYGTMDIGGDYATIARSLGAYGERVKEPAQIVPALRRGVEQTMRGMPVLLEFITCRELRQSTHGRSRYHQSASGQASR